MLTAEKFVFEAICIKTYRYCHQSLREKSDSASPVISY